MEQPLFDYLRGNWALSRSITDRLGGEDGDFAGSAVFEGNGPTLLYSESGTLTLGETEMVAERRYRWDCAADGADVLYDDGRAFHSFTLAAPEASHLCGKDWYRGRYIFGPDRWQVTWQVTGPAKNYTSISVYRRG